MNKTIDIQHSGSYLYEKDDILQSWGIIINTIKGSDPMRPEFGCSMMDYIDKPFELVRGSMIAMIIEELENFETRASISKVNIDMEEIGKYKITIYGTVNRTNEDIQYIDVISSLSKDMKNSASETHTSFDESFNNDFN